MNRRCIRACLLMVVVACIMGADAISFDKGQPKWNPQVDEFTVEGKGTFGVDPGNDLDKVVLHARGPTPTQLNKQVGKADKTKWEAAMRLPVGEYEVWVELTTTNKKTGATNVTVTKSVKVIVPKTGKLIRAK